MENSKVMKRIESVEKAISDLTKVVKSLKVSIDQVIVSERQKSSNIEYVNARGHENLITTEAPLHANFPNRNVIGVSDDIKANPWALETALKLLDDRIERRAITNSFNTYKPTLDALKSESSWLSAKDVAKKTKRERNTESGYLNKLYRAGLLQRRKKGNKVVFAIAEEEAISQIYGESG